MVFDDHTTLCRLTNSFQCVPYQSGTFHHYWSYVSFEKLRLYNTSGHCFPDGDAIRVSRRRVKISNDVTRIATEIKKEQ